MFSRARTLAICLALVCLAAPAIAAAEPGFTRHTLHFAVLVGPNDDVSCDIVGDLYTPVGAGSAAPVPAILTTSGFAQSKDELVRMSTLLVEAGYAVLAYSGLGFGGSSCKATMDDPSYDGKAASQLVSFLGGKSGFAYTDVVHRNPVLAPDYVVLDDPAAHDPRLGMIGNSYGGQVQFAAASIDARIDTIVPAVTWNDLTYSLAPNDADTGVPGVAKLLWILGLTGIGAANPGVAGYTADPARAVPCPNLTDQVCAIVTSGLPRGYPDPVQAAFMANSSVANYIDKITVPVLLMQGQADTLFNLNEARATYDALQRQGTEVKMIWHSWGHSNTEPAVGELYGGDPRERYQARRILDWFGHYLRGSAVSTGPEFSYFRDWIDYSGDATPAYASAPTVDVATLTQLWLSGNGRLADAPAGITPGVQSLTTAPAGLPTQTRALDPRPGIPVPQWTIPGTFAQWTSAPRTAPLDVVGAPELALTISTARPINGSLDDSVVLFAKLYDVDPAGVATLVEDQVAPVRIVDPGRPVTVTMPAIVHRFAPGHSVRLEIAGGDLNYRGGLAVHQVTVAAGATQALTLPTVTP